MILTPSVELIQQIGRLLATSLNHATQKQSEEALRQLETVPGFVFSLLSIVEGQPGMPDQERHVRQAAAILFKNFIKNNWPNDYSNALSADDRRSIKASLIDRMLAVAGDASIQVQLAEAIVQIAALDFPQAWPELLTNLTAHLGDDQVKNIAVLRTLHYVFKRYRSEGRSDELFSEINFVMAQFAPILLQLYAKLDALMMANGQNKPVLEHIVSSAVYCNKIFYSLSSQDLPAYFEDHMAEFMAVFKRHFTFECTVLEDSSEEETEGPLERLRGSVAEIINLYAVKYEEDFPMMPEFVELSWVILTTHVRSPPKYDRLAGFSMAFLATVSRQERHKALFGPVLQLICDKIILPNMIFRDSDLELFEDEPLEFIRRDQELMASGVEDASRRAAAVLLTRGLMEYYEPEITNILGAYIQQYMDQYALAPAAKWREKDVATQLFSAIAIKGSVQLYGVTRVNSMVNIADFFQKNVQSDLQPANEALHPILKMDAIKFVHQFRMQLGKADLVAVFPQLMHHIASHNHVIHTYAAMAVERILAIKGPAGPMFTTSDLKPVVQPLVQNLLQLIMSRKGTPRLAENEMLMKALMRVMLLAQRDLLLPIVPLLSDSLSELLFEVAKNPSNPRFNHFMFESIMALIRFCGPDPASMSHITTKLMTVFQEIIQADLVEFMPYLLQLYAGLVEFSSDPLLPSYARDLLQVALQPPLWSSPGNVPALLRFIQACLRKESLDYPSLLPPLLGVFQTLLGSRVNDLHAFSLFNTIIQTVPRPQLLQYLQPSMMLLLGKLQSMRVSKISSSVLLTVCTMILSFDASLVFNLLEGIQPRMIVGLMKSSLLPEATKINGKNDRKACIMAIAKLAVECPELQGKIFADQSYAPLWLSALSSCLSLIANLQEQSQPDPEAQLYEESRDEEPLQSGSAFARLQVLPTIPRFAEIAVDPVSFLVNGLSQMSKTSPPGALNQLIDSGLEVNQRNVLHHILQQMNVTL